MKKGDDQSTSASGESSSQEEAGTEDANKGRGMKGKTNTAAAATATATATADSSGPPTATACASASTASAGAAAAASDTHMQLSPQRSHSGNTPSAAIIAEQRWEELFLRLQAFREEHGHTNVPNRYERDAQLGCWVSTQRRQYKKAQQSQIRQTPQMLQRIKRLEELGFEWEGQNPRHKNWNLRFQALLEFKAKYGHAQVPIGWEEDVQLANWTSTQRQEYKNLIRGKPSRLNEERMQLLNSVGFAWELQRGGRRRQVSIHDADSSSSDEDDDDDNNDNEETEKEESKESTIEDTKPPSKATGKGPKKRKRTKKGRKRENVAGSPGSMVLPGVALIGGDSRTSVANLGANTNGSPASPPTRLPRHAPTRSISVPESSSRNVSVPPSQVPSSLSTNNATNQFPQQQRYSMQSMGRGPSNMSYSGMLGTIDTGSNPFNSGNQAQAQAPMRIQPSLLVQLLQNQPGGLNTDIARALLFNSATAAGSNQRGIGDNAFPHTLTNLGVPQQRRQINSNFGISQDPRAINASISSLQSQYQANAAFLGQSNILAPHANVSARSASMSLQDNQQLSTQQSLPSTAQLHQSLASNEIGSMYQSVPGLGTQSMFSAAMAAQQHHHRQQQVVRRDASEAKVPDRSAIYQEVDSGSDEEQKLPGQGPLKKRRR